MVDTLTRHGLSRPLTADNTPGDTTQNSQIPAALRAPYHHSDLTQSQVMGAIPAGSRRYRNQVEALRCALTAPELADVRADFRANLEAVYRILVLHSSWGGEDGFGRRRAPRCVTAPTRKRICKLAGISLTTYKRCVRWWRDRGYLAVVRRGWAPMLRAAVLVDEKTDTNISQAWVICGPRKRLKPACGLSETKSPVEKLVDNQFGSSAGTCGKVENNHESNKAPRISGPLTGLRSRPVKASPTQARARKDQNRAPKTKGQKTGRRRGRPGAERARCLQSGIFGAVTDGWWTTLTWVFAVAGWTAADLVYAVDHQPDGTVHWRTSRVTTPDERGGAARILRWRLALWLGADGTPLPAPSQQRAERERARKAAAERQERELGLKALSAKRRAQHPDEHHDYADPSDGPQQRPERPRKPRPAESSATGPSAAHSGPVPPQRPGDDSDWTALTTLAAMAADGEANGNLTAAAAAKDQQAVLLDQAGHSAAAAAARADALRLRAEHAGHPEAAEAAAAERDRLLDEMDAAL